MAETEELKGIPVSKSFAEELDSNINTPIKFNNVAEQRWNPLSYKVITNTMADWKKSGTRGSEYNQLDIPGHYFFKIIFHFWNGDAYGEDSKILESGLLAPTWSTTTTKDPADETDKGINTDEIIKERNELDNAIYSFEEDQKKDSDSESSGYKGITLNPMHNSAYNFLIRNDELDRAELLKQFITLLSNISSYSPWYFYEIAGLDGILEKPINHNEEHKLELPKSFTIKCLPDSADDRIGTLLDLYRSIVYSHSHHREILPANLRKFDMSIYIFSSPLISITQTKDRYGSIYNDPAVFSTEAIANNDYTSFRTSFKRIELHDCEIDYNSTKSAYSSLTNAEGFQMIYEIPILVGDVYETRYNTFIDREMGDMIAIDMARNAYSKNGHIQKILLDNPQYTEGALITDLNNRINNYYGTIESSSRKHLGKLFNTRYSGGINLLDMVDDLTGNIVSSFAKQTLLGNLHKTSITDIEENLEKLSANIATGNIGATIQNINELSEVRNGWYVGELGNLHNRTTIYNK